MKKSTKKSTKKCKAKRTSEKLIKFNRFGMPVVAILAVMIFVVNIVTASYSWFSPTTQTGIGMQFQETTAIRSEKCSFVTFAEQSSNNGLITYSSSETSGSVTVNAGTTKHFKTVITNQSSDYATSVSLYIETFSGLSTGSGVGLGVARPSSSYHVYTETQHDLWIIRNAYIPKYVQTDTAPGVLTVEWFVKNMGTGVVYVNVGKLYLMYN